MFGMKKKEDIPGDITGRIDQMDMPVSQAESRKAAAIAPPTPSSAPMPTPGTKLPALSGTESDEGMMLEQEKMMAPSAPPMPSAASSKLKGMKGPVFISLKKYKELRTDLDALKQTSAHLKSILVKLKDNRDSGFDLLERSTDTLLKLEEQSEAVNNLMKN